MRVAIVYHFFAHYRGPIINELLEDENIEYYFLAGTKKNKSYKSLKLFDFTENNRFIELENYWFFGFFLWQRKLIKTISKQQFDAIILLGDWKFLSTWIATFILNIKKIPAMFWSHGLLDSNQSLNNKIKFLFFKMFKRGGFVYGHRAKEIMTVKGYRYPIEVIYNSLDYEKQVAIKDKILQTGIVQNQLMLEKRSYVIFSGRIEERKNLEILIDAIAYLNNSNINIKGLIIGAGDHLINLKHHAENLNIAHNIIFFGSCYDEEILAEFFLGAIACVIPDIAGLAVIHSLTYGIPVITSDDISAHPPEVEAVIDGITGWFFKKGDHISLSEKITILTKLSTEQRNTYTHNCLESIAKNYTPKNQHAIFNKKLISLFNRNRVI